MSSKNEILGKLHIFSPHRNKHKKGKILFIVAKIICILLYAYNKIYCLNMKKSGQSYSEYMPISKIRWSAAMMHKYKTSIIVN